MVGWLVVCLFHCFVCCLSSEPVVVVVVACCSRLLLPLIVWFAGLLG